MKELILILLYFPLILISQSSMNMNLLGSFNYDTNHNTKCNDIWGWEDDNGNEFALVGLENGFSCVDVTNPAIPIEMFYISDINSIWRDIKTWGELVGCLAHGSSEKNYARSIGKQLRAVQEEQRNLYDQLATVPPYIDKNVYQAYSFTEYDIEALKEAKYEVLQMKENKF